MRVVLDTNVFASSALGGQIGAINAAWRASQFTLIMSDVIFSEYIDVLSRPKLHLTAEIVSAIIARVQRKAEFVTSTEIITAVEADPTDNKFLEAALEGQADYVVSGDRHLLDLKTFRSIPILTAREFIERLKD